MSQFDASEFVDDDFEQARHAPPRATAASTAPVSAHSGRAPTREEVESKVDEMQHKLTELKRAQQDLERERASLEETRRRQVEFVTGRDEMVQHLTRGVGLLEEAEFGARRDAEQMAKALAGLRDALVKIQSIHEETWTKDNLNAELTRAATVVENARLEWNGARLKFPVLSAVPADSAAMPAGADSPLPEVFGQKSYAELCKVGLALTWPLALIGVMIVLALLVLLLNH